MKRHNEKLLETLEQRRNILEQQQARYGLDVPPHILLELDELRDEIEHTKMRHRGIMSAELLASMPPAEIWKNLYDSQWETNVIIYAMQKETERDRKNIQNRHREFNETIQKLIFENELLKRNQRYMFMALVFLSLCLIVILFIFALFL